MRSHSACKHTEPPRASRAIRAVRPGIALHGMVSHGDQSPDRKGGVALPFCGPRTNTIAWHGPLARGRKRDALALLEVVLSISILALAMGVVGAAFRTGAQHVKLADRMVRAGNLTERLLTHIDLGLVTVSEQGGSGDFDEQAELGMSWTAQAYPDPLLPGLYRLTVDIYMDDPQVASGLQKILSTTVLRVEPRNIDLETDFGFTEDQLDLLTQAVPGGEALLDPHDFDPRTVAQLDLETLRDLLPALMGAMGVNLGPGGLDALLQAAQQGNIDEAFRLGEKQTPGPAQPQGK